MQLSVYCVVFMFVAAVSSRGRRNSEPYVGPNDIGTPNTNDDGPVVVEDGTDGFYCSEQVDDSMQAIDGNYAAENCANYFWQCSGFVQYRTPCATDNTWYNMEIDACVSFANVPGCEGGGDVNMMNTDGDESAQPCEGKPTGFFPVAGECDRYVVCLQSLAFTVLCDQGNVFNRAVRRCEVPEKVYGVCGSDDASTFSCSGLVDGLYRSSMDCALYYECADKEIFFVHKCPDFHSFDQSTMQCAPFQTVAECLPSQDLSIGERFCAAAGRDGLFADPRSCRGSVICLYDSNKSHYNAYSFRCTDPEEPAWDDQTKQCGPAVAGCSIAVPIE
jgi:hypothetical protein